MCWKFLLQNAQPIYKQSTIQGEFEFVSGGQFSIILTKMSGWRWITFSVQNTKRSVITLGVTPAVNKSLIQSQEKCLETCIHKNEKYKEIVSPRTKEFRVGCPIMWKITCHREHVSTCWASKHWHNRFHILRGTCCGLVYLHIAEHPIVHQDIKIVSALWCWQLACV